MQRYALDPATPVLLRPDGTVQVGWDPRRAVLIRPPCGLSTPALADLLRLMQSGVSVDELRERADSVEPAVIDDLVATLTDAKLLTRSARRRPRAAAIRIHGRGPLSDLLSGALRCSGARITHSSRTHCGTPPGPTDLVVLTDYLVADPRVVRDLQDAGVPHLPVRVRDGTGLVGPLVIPGVTSCLTCADLHRSDRDAAWPAVAAQLRNTVGNADRATVLATAALALAQVDKVVRAVRAGREFDRSGDPPAVLNTTLEFDVNVGAVVPRRWSRHPRCGC